MEDRTIKIEIRNNYGQDRFYPANKTAERFLQLTGKKTFSERELHVIIELGFIVSRKEQYANLFKG
jgi:hypothetical protein